ncbi:amidohydrolase family protein [Engelhardtia mirabilis]|uniref:Aminodeoxyfutalosine deaminase n=1 Tax=Engelhardtia mirabilis TaxID=2528011 RepID=A0A518BP68_9BACT|nr:Aminodeoxyfutalosine deaminase [Planctomycetes bacterium Pla133]QDV03098.1 Aminodeoxyfutalosine deaminase [Planctomycetes bacterium Pla86]
MSPEQSAKDDRRLFRARWILPRSGVVHVDGAVQVAGGVVEEVLPDHGAVGRAGAAGIEIVDLGDVALTPGLVNAHAHLELGALAGRLPRARPFEEWVGALLALRAAADAGELESGLARDGRALLESGTTAVGDIDSLGLAATAGPTAMPRRRVYRELLDGRDAARRAAIVAALSVPLAETDHLLEGLSPHAPFSISDELLAAVASTARVRGLPVAMHWAETPEEVAWLDGGEGWFGRFFPPAAGMAGIDALERHGLLGPATTLIHGNHPRADEPRRIASAGATVVHCPGSHAYFERGPFPLQRYLDVGVPIALGTDSSASNDRLDMRRELALLRTEFPGLDPIRAWSAATEVGARGLGLQGRAGCLAPGAWADLVAFELPEPLPADSWDWLTAAAPAVRGTWIGGRPVPSDALQ